MARPNRVMGAPYSEKREPFMPNTAKIRELNDAFRTTLIGGRTVITPAIAAQPDLAQIVELVKSYETFDLDNDPYAEHDFGAFRIGEQQVFWKIDYYDVDLQGGSPDPSDPAVTTRVLTILRADEY